MASGNVDWIAELKKDVAIWNINSFAEYYLQIYQLYSKTYDEACDKIVEEREWLSNELKKFKSIKVYPSSANYIMVDLKKNNSHELTITLLDKHNLIIKDLSTKNKFIGKNYIRLAVRDRKDNEILIRCLKQYLK